MFSIVLRSDTFTTLNTYHQHSLKFFRLVPVKSRLLKFAPLGCVKFRGKQEVVFEHSLVLSPMRRSQPPPKVGPYALKQQIALFLIALARGYLTLSETENRKVSFLKSDLKQVEFFSNCSSQVSGVNPPIILRSSVRQRVSVSQYESHIQWKSATLKLWLLALYKSLKVTLWLKKLDKVSKDSTIQLELTLDSSAIISFGFRLSGSYILFKDNSESASESISLFFAAILLVLEKFLLYRVRFSLVMY